MGRNQITTTHGHTAHRKDSLNIMIKLSYTVLDVDQTANDDWPSPQVATSSGPDC